MTYTGHENVLKHLENESSSTSLEASWKLLREL